MGLEMAGKSRLQVVGSRQCGRDGVGQETVWPRAGLRQQARDGAGETAAKSGMKSGLCFPKGEPRTTKKVNHPNT